MHATRKITERWFAYQNRWIVLICPCLFCLCSFMASFVCVHFVCAQQEEDVSKKSPNESGNVGTKVSIEGLKEKEGSVAPLDPWESPSAIERNLDTSNDSLSKPSERKATAQKLDWRMLPDDTLSSVEGLESIISVTDTQNASDKLTPRMRQMRLEMAKRQGVLVEPWHKQLSGDIRGAPELRLCSVCTNGLRPSKESMLPNNDVLSIIDATIKVKCDVLAIQGIAGRNYSVVQETVDYISKLLENKAGPKFRGVAGEVGKHYRSSAILWNEEHVSLIDANPATGRGLAKMDLFPNRPLVINVMVRGVDGSESKELVLINYDLSTGGGFFIKPDVNHQIEMAEMLRVFAVKLQTTFEQREPIVSLLGYRAGGKYAPQSRVLSGRLRMSNFAQDDLVVEDPEESKDASEAELEEDGGATSGRCIINDKGELKCDAGVLGFPQVTFGVLSERLLDDDYSILKLSKWNISTFYYSKPEQSKIRQMYKEQREKYSEIYLFSRDLRYVKQHYQVEGMYIGGFEDVKTGVPESPLVWTELNW